MEQIREYNPIKLEYKKDKPMKGKSIGNGRVRPIKNIL